jgi:hypothetical protein
MNMDRDNRGVARYIELQLKAVLGIEQRFLLDADKEFSHYGMNSIVSARFCHALSQELQQEITPKTLLDHYTLNKLTRYFIDELNISSLPGSPSTALADADGDANETSAVAIAGRSADLCRCHQDSDQQDKDALIQRIIQALKSKNSTAADTEFSFIFFSTGRHERFQGCLVARAPFLRVRRRVSRSGVAAG